MVPHELRVFVRACELGSLSAVAREEGVTQSAISQHVRRLERQVGAPLLERGRQGVRPTAEGKLLLDAARTATVELDRAQRQITRLRQGDSGTIRVATGGATLRHFMTKPLARFRRRYPNVAFEYVSVNSTRQCLQTLRDDRADIAFITISDDATVEQRPTVRSNWVVVVLDTDPLADLEAIEPTDLTRLRPIAMPSTTTSRSQLEAHLARHSVQLTFAATVDDWDTAVLLAELGAGHAIVPNLWIHDLRQHRHLRAVPIAAIPPVTFGWAARDWSSLPETALAFASLVDGTIANLNGTTGEHTE